MLVTPVWEMLQVSLFLSILSSENKIWGLWDIVFIAAHYRVCNRPMHAAFPLLPFHLFTGGLFTLQTFNSFLI